LARNVENEKWNPEDAGTLKKLATTQRRRVVRPDADAELNLHPIKGVAAAVARRVVHGSGAGGGGRSE